MKDNNLTNILNIYENDISKNIKNKNKLYYFEINKIQNIIDIVNMLNQGNIGHNKYNIFLIYEPKERLVMSLPVKDKIINHFIARYILEKKLTKYLDYRNCATRKNMGTDYAIKLLKKYLEENKRKYHNFYFLKIDIKKYFYNIDHNVLKELLKNDLSNEEYDLLSKIIDSTNNSYINERIEYLKNKYHVDIPLYQHNKGLPIGNMTSQFLAIFYLNKVDHYIIHDLKLKYYVRYMDDSIILSDDLDYLKEALEKIKKLLKEKYKLDIHNKKTFIMNIKHGFSFLGYSFKIVNNKTIIKVVKKIKNKIKYLKYALDNDLISSNKVFSSIMTYKYSYKYANRLPISNIIERYFYNE